jgi:hypothetical protein
MSWSINLPAKPQTEFSGAVDHAEPTHHLSDGQLAQVRTAKKFVKDLVDSGALGQGEDVFIGGYISGHAGSSDGPQVGDTINVSINRSAAPA